MKLKIASYPIEKDEVVFSQLFEFYEEFFAGNNPSDSGLNVVHSSTHYAFIKPGYETNYYTLRADPDLVVGGIWSHFDTGSDAPPDEYIGYIDFSEKEWVWHVLHVIVGSRSACELKLLESGKVLIWWDDPDGDGEIVATFDSTTRQLAFKPK